MTPDETKIWNAAVRKCAQLFTGPTYRVILGELIPETEAERLALECHATDKVEVIAWMLGREKRKWHEREAVATAKEVLAEIDAAKTEYVYGPEVPGTTTWPEGTEYQTRCPDNKNWYMGESPNGQFVHLTRRRIYRIDQTYEHDGSDVCPLADPYQKVDVRYRYPSNTMRGCAGAVRWEHVTHFTPVKEG